MNEHVPAPVRSGVGDLQQFHAAMAVVDAQGWDSTPGLTILEYARSQVVFPAVAMWRPPAQDREDALSTGWAAAWRALTTQPVRAAESPWGVVRIAVQRALGGRYVAERYGTTASTGWDRLADGTPPLRITAVAGQSLERIIDEASYAAAAPGAGGVLGQRLQWICEVLVVAGWTADVAEAALVWVALNYAGSAAGERSVRNKAMDQAKTGDGRLVDAAVVAENPNNYTSLRCMGCATSLTVQAPSQPKVADGKATPALFRLARGCLHTPGCPHDVAGSVVGWRQSADSLGLQAWQLRRIALLVAGGRTHVGLLELVVRRGRAVLTAPAVKRSIATTLHRWAPCPSSVMAAKYGTAASLRCAA